MNEQENLSYEFGPFRLDPTSRLLLRDGQPEPLTPKAFEILLALVENSGQLVSKRELMKRVWPDTIVEEANLANNISLLRKIL
ncbi:MAG: winged helix-turn-helix domain-containing protein, partial [Blastocatellia bacterium]